MEDATNASAHVVEAGPPNHYIIPSPEALIDESRRLYQATSNPMFVFSAYLTARNRQREVPPWVLLAFDGIAKRLLFDTSGENSHGSWPERVYDSIGFARKRGMGSPVEQMTNASRRYAWAIKVRVAMAEHVGPTTDGLMVAFVANALGVGVPSVADAWKTYKAHVMQGTIEEQQRVLRWLELQSDGWRDERQGKARGGRTKVATP